MGKGLKEKGEPPSAPPKEGSYLTGKGLKKKENLPQPLQRRGVA